MLNISNFMIREIKGFLIKFPLEDSCTKSMFPEMVLKFTMREISMYRVNIKCLPCLSSGIWEKKRCSVRAVLERILETQAAETVGI